MRQRKIGMVAMLLAMTAMGVVGAPAKANRAYVFSYFSDKPANGRSGEAAGLHLAWSKDGKTWTALNNDEPVLIPNVGKRKLMRDPSICQGPDGTYHLVWTTSWSDRIIGCASSRDLIHWSEQKAIPVMEHEPTARNCWAPEVTYNPDDGLFYIYWATTIPGRHDPKGHRIYLTTTKDWKTFSKTKLWFDPGYSAIDAALVRDPVAKDWIMVVKNENEPGHNGKPAEKNIRVARMKDLAKDIPQPTGPSVSPNWVEGPSALFVGDSLYVYFDCYTKHRYGAIRSDDHGKTWKDVSEEISFPKGIRHGTALEVSIKLVEQLQKLK